LRGAIPPRDFFASRSVKVEVPLSVHAVCGPRRNNPIVARVPKAYERRAISRLAMHGRGSDVPEPRFKASHRRKLEA
jgi:hypothetical protein